MTINGQMFQSPNVKKPNVWDSFNCVHQTSWLVLKIHFSAFFAFSFFYYFFFELFQRMRAMLVEKFCEICLLKVLFFNYFITSQILIASAEAIKKIFVPQTLFHQICRFSFFFVLFFFFLSHQKWFISNKRPNGFLEPQIDWS